MGIASFVLFGGQGLSAATVTHWAIRSPGARFALLVGWLRATGPVVRPLVNSPELSFLRPLPVPLPRILGLVAWAMVFAGAPMGDSLDAWRWRHAGRGSGLPCAGPFYMLFRSRACATRATSRSYWFFSRLGWRLGLRCGWFSEWSASWWAFAQRGGASSSRRAVRRFARCIAVERFALAAAYWRTLLQSARRLALSRRSARGDGCGVRVPRHREQ